MIFLCALVGLAVGSLLNWAGDYLPRFSNSAPPSFEPASRPAFALWRLLKSFEFRGNSVHASRSLGPDAAVEFFTALLFAYLWERFGASWRLLLLAAACSFFLLVAIIDQKYRLVLDVMIYPAVVVTLILRAISPEKDMAAALVGGAMGLCVFLAAALVKQGGLGGGDVKLAAVIGLVIGFPEMLWALAVGIVAGGITALVLVLSPRWELKSHMPYAPFLCLGTIIALLYNPLPLIFPSFYS